MGLKPINTWSLIKQGLRISCVVENLEGQGQGQANVKLMESSIVKEIIKTHAMEEKKRVEQGSFNEEQSVIESIDTSLEESKCKKSVVSTKETVGKTKESECLTENNKSFKDEQVEDKQYEIEKCKKSKEEMSLIVV
ncbi:hypothetical protein M9H77_19228 [Catharanthus roseus]|uniref:Uncharacterized protein n=1 Tax=Catharanthus roseus TaxID=4058 RepID=A0ACC0B9R0_CATRO|nr:hypothetical protein M9H77_19228 [Catharanthus roseus]